jgi:hypothetical protein
MEDNFKKILDKKYGMKKIEDILKRHKFYESGNQDKLLEIVSNNTTIFEEIINELLYESYQDEIKEICHELDIDSKSKVGELKKKILDKLNKHIENRNIENKIKFLSSSSAFHKEDLEDILKRHKFHKSGNKDKLVEKCARNDFLVKAAMIKWNRPQKNIEHIQEMCDTLGVDSRGKRNELLKKIEECVFKNETKKDIQNELTVISTNSSKYSLKSQNNFPHRKIFKSDVDGLTEIKERNENKLFDYEKHLQTLIEKNVDRIFPELEFIYSEFPVEELRIDSVCFNNQTNSFTIIEYKNIKHGGVIDQGMAYLDLLEHNKAEFILLYQTQKEKILKDVNWDAIKVIVISPEFTPHQLRASFRTNDPIELYQIRRFHDETLIVERIRNKKK